MKSKIILSAIFVLFFGILFSQKKNSLVLVSAEKKNWFGGREGIKGVQYHMEFQNLSSKKITVDKLMIRGETLVPNVITKGKIISVVGIWQEPTKELNDATTVALPLINKPIDKVDDVVLFYHIGICKTQYQIKITQFKNKVINQPKDELIN